MIRRNYMDAFLPIVSIFINNEGTLLGDDYMSGPFTKYNYIIVGSGAGGATLAKELSKKADKILVIEKGKEETSYGTFTDAARYFDSNALYLPKKSKEGIIIWRSLMAGGSGFVSAGNLIRCMGDTFRALNIDLEDEFIEAEKELMVAPISGKLISDGSRGIAEAALQLGWPMEPSPKAIITRKCIRCGKCTLGCITGAKWTPVTYLKEAEECGAEIRYNTKAEKILFKNGQVEGVQVRTKKGLENIKAEKVILSAGGLGTPVILQASGIVNAGANLFVDIFLNVYGIHETLNLNHEPQMSMICDSAHDTEGFILSTFMNHPRALRFLEAGFKGYALPTSQLLGLMVKIKDDNVGRVYPNGTVSKKMTKNDWKKLKTGTRIAKEILKLSGVYPNSFVVTKLQGGHPGGTAAIGQVVDTNLETKIGNLFVCDSSVFPEAPGMPPILTIIALAKWLSKRV